MKARSPFLVRLLAAIALGAAFPVAAAEIVDHHGMVVAVMSEYYECLTCHDGMMAPAVEHCTGNCDFKSSHSIMRLYPPPGKEKEYASTEEVEAAGVKFLHGRIGCISCHNIEQSSKYHLVVDISGSRLCLTCHRV